MPFYNNVYYPFPPESQWAHTSAGIPSLLNSPQSQLSSGSQSRPTGAAMSGVPASFTFRTRRENVDWRRISAVDVGRVACELDFQTLQDHIMAVTFCNIEGERCPHCQSQVDPALLKLFRLAQLTVEYLLHSQDCLTLSLQTAEEQLQAEALEKDQLKMQLQKQTQDTKSLKGELKQRKKIIASQQAMITTGIANYHKCQHCEKAFMNASFLQSHVHRRHPIEHNIKVITDNQKKAQTMKLQEEVNRLQEQLTLARSQIETQHKDYSAKQEKDLTQKQEEFIKQLEIWKEDERVRMNSKIDEVKQACQRDMDSLHQRNRNLEKEVLKLQQSSKMQESMQAQETSMQNSENKHLQEVIQLQQKLHKQGMKWAAKMQKMKEEYEKEKSQLQSLLAQMHSSMSDKQEEAQRQMKKMELMLQEQCQIIASKNKQMKQITSNQLTPVLQQEALEAKLRTVNEQTSSVHKLDPIVELSEEDKDSSSISEGLIDTQSWQQKADELLKKPGLKREMRMAVQQSLHDKLVSLGVKPGVCELSKTVYKRAVTWVVSKREQKQEKDSEYHKIQMEVSRKLEQRLKEINTEAPSKFKQPVHAMKIIQSRPQSSSLPITITRVVSGPPPRQQHTPQPAPWTGTLPKTSTPRLHQKTPPFSSDEGSSEEEESEEDSYKSPRSCLPKGQEVNTTTMQTQPPRTQPGTALQAADSPQTLALRSGVSLAPVVTVSRTEVTAVESESEWTEGSEMEEIALDQLQKHTDQNGNVHNSHSDVKILSKNLEQPLTERGLKKTAGGFNTVPSKSSVVTNTNDVVQDLKKYTEVNDDDDDDWDISSLEDISAALNPCPASMRISTNKSVDTSTSVWGISTGKRQKPGLNDAGTGNTLKSSIVTYSDWDDSDGI